MDVTNWACVADDPRRIVPIGRPIGNLACYVLDRRLEPVPIGVAGELYLAGVGLARGYLDRADLTAEQFIPNPLSDIPGSRMYKTGDLARWLADGTLEHLGRLDHQVKIRGNRIELGEIEAALRTMDGVAEAACAAVELEGTATLCAYLVAAESQEVPSIETLRSALSNQLPAYMVPSSFTVLESLPLTTSGKVDRRSLPVPGVGDRPALEQVYVQPEGETETRLSAIFAEVLRVERVGALDNYFALGGDSIRSIQVLARARSEGLHFTLPQLFSGPTVRELATQVLQSAVDGPIERIAPLGLLARRGCGPSSRGCGGCLSADRTAGGNVVPCGLQCRDGGVPRRVRVSRRSGTQRSGAACGLEHGSATSCGAADPFRLERFLTALAVGGATDDHPAARARSARFG